MLTKHDLLLRIDYLQGEVYGLSDDLIKLQKKVDALSKAKPLAGEPKNSSSTVVCKTREALEKAIKKKEKDAEWILVRKYENRETHKWVAIFDRV